MESFLQELARDLFKKYEYKISECIIVFPNRRAGVFFRKYLIDHVENPIWSPTILSIEDFIRNQSKLQVVDKLTLIFELYQIYRKHLANKEAFDHFYFWGEMLVKDFDEVDRYLINTKDLFSNLKAISKFCG